MKALIIFGSPRNNGNTASLIKTFVENFDGETDFIYAFPNANNKGIAPCINCEVCKQGKCVFNDDFYKILKDDYDVLLVASPLYMSNMPGPMLNVISRFNYFFHSGKNLEAQKTGVLILTGGGHAAKRMQGNSNEDLAIRQADFIFANTNTKLNNENIVLSLNTDKIPAKDDKIAQEKIKHIAQKLNHTYGI